MLRFVLFVFHYIIDVKYVSAFCTFGSSQSAEFPADSFHWTPPFNLARRGRVDGNDFTRSMIVRGGTKDKASPLGHRSNIYAHFVSRVLDLLLSIYGAIYALNRTGAFL